VNKFPLNFFGLPVFNRRMKKILLPLVALAALIAACVPSVYPFYFDKDVVTDAHLPGNWQESDKTNNPEMWLFENAASNSYAATYTETDGKTGRFEAHLFKLGETTFLDLTPAECNYATNQADLIGISMIPGHLLLRVKLSADKLSVATINPDWLKKFLDQNPNAIAHRVDHDEIFLTSETGTLQKFILKHLGTNELFGEEGDYIRPPK
jgi:hypothetical protein